MLRSYYGTHLQSLLRLLKKRGIGIPVLIEWPRLLTAAQYADATKALLPGLSSIPASWMQ